MIKKTKHIFLGFIPYHMLSGLVRLLRPIGLLVANRSPQLRTQLRKTALDFTPEDYISYGLLTYGFFAVLLALLLFVVSFRIAERELAQSVVLAFGAGAGMFLLFVYLLLRMPSIQAKTNAAMTEKYLLFALQDVLLQINAGSTLYAAMVSVAESGYGEVSDMFDSAARKINAGKPLESVLHDMVTRTDSEYLKRALWQMTASLRAGADLRRTLSNVVVELNAFQRTQIQSYARELNLWSLGYMLFAVAIPTIGSTLLVILSTFAGFGVTQITFIMFIVLSLCVQFGMVMFVKSRRPVVQF